MTTTETKRHGATQFVALELSIEILARLKDVIAVIRRRNRHLASQIERSASSVTANLAEGNERVSNDRLHFFRIAAGSARETQAHLRVALTLGLIQPRDVQNVLPVLDRELGVLWGLTHPKR
jgi:four helix bundle protein